MIDITFDELDLAGTAKSFLTITLYIHTHLAQRLQHCLIGRNVDGQPGVLELDIKSDFIVRIELCTGRAKMFNVKHVVRPILTQFRTNSSAVDRVRMHRSCAQAQPWPNTTLDRDAGYLAMDRDAGDLHDRFEAY